jgi:hypothetical protein
MPLGAFRINSLAKFTVVADGEVIRAKKGVTAVGDAQVSTAQSQFGGASALFDGSGDYLGITQYEPFIFGTSIDFTIECWIRLNALGITQTIWDQRTTINGAFPTLYVANDNRIKYYTQGNPRINGDVLTTGVWYHVALVRSGTDYKI